MHKDYFSSGVIGASLIISILVAWAVILVPSHAAPSLHPEGMNGADRASSIVSNASRKGDRLTPRRSKIEIEHGSVSEPAYAIKTAPKIPAGCETAFSNRVRSEKVAVRCVT